MNNHQLLDTLSDALEAADRMFPIALGMEFFSPVESDTWAEAVATARDLFETVKEYVNSDDYDPERPLPHVLVVKTDEGYVQVASDAPESQQIVRDTFGVIAEWTHDSFDPEQPEPVPSETEPEPEQVTA